MSIYVNIRGGWAGKIFFTTWTFVETRRNLYELCAPQFEIYLYRERTTNEIHSLKNW